MSIPENELDGMIADLKEVGLETSVSVIGRVTAKQDSFIRLI